MIAWLARLEWWEVGLLFGGAIALFLAVGFWLTERSFRREWEAPAQPEDWAMRAASGAWPELKVEQEPAVIRTLSQDWRIELGAAPAHRPRHRREHIEDHTQLLPMFGEGDRDGDNAGETQRL